MNNLSMWKAVRVLLTAATAAFALTFTVACTDTTPSGGDSSQQEDDDDDDDDHKKKKHR